MRAGRRPVLRPVCAWRGCPHAPDLEVEYRPATDYAGDEAVDGAVLAVDLCRAHAAALRRLLRPGQIVRTTQL
jgi:hypothetical protein